MDKNNPELSGCLALSESHRTKIKELIGEIECEKHFRCVEVDATSRCKAKDIGDDTFAECLDAENATSACSQALACGQYVFCKCPLL